MMLTKKYYCLAISTQAEMRVWNSSEVPGPSACYVATSLPTVDKKFCTIFQIISQTDNLSLMIAATC